jgi:hypothetical protein
MSNATINQVYLDAFRDNVRQLAQQMGSKARAWTDQFSAQAETGNWDRLGDAEAGAKTRKMATPEGARVWSRRIAVATPYNDAEIVESEDPSLMIADPNSNIVQSLGYSMGRKQDDIIFAAAVGTALTSVRSSDGSNAPTSDALPAGQTIGDGTGAMSFDLVTEALQQFNTNDVPLEDDRVCFIGPQQVRELMNLTENTSSDYVNREALQNLNSSGVVANWMGATWIMSTRLPIPATGQRSCIMMTRKAMGFHIPQDITTFVERDPSLSYAWRPYCQFTAGAVRVEDEHIVRLHVADATAP